MGKEIRPKREELEFLFNMFLRGLSDSDVVARYIDLEDKGKLTFPLRTDRRTISKIRDEFEAARSVLEPHLRRQIDPAVQKARDEHLNGVREWLRGWRGTISFEEVNWVEPSAYRRVPKSFADEKNSAWFKSLSEHLPRPDHDSLWDLHESWEAVHVEYLRLHEALRQRIVEDAKTRFDLAAQEAKEKQLLEAEANKKESSDTRHLKWTGELVFPHVTESFTAPFFKAINRQKLELEFQYPKHYYVAGAEMVLEGLQVNGMEVLVAENPLKSNKSMYEAMVKEYLESDRVTDLLESLRCLRELTDKIRIALDEISERRDYIRHTCWLCPSSAKV